MLTFDLRCFLQIRLWSLKPLQTQSSIIQVITSGKNDQYIQAQKDWVTYEAKDQHTQSFSRTGELNSGIIHGLSLSIFVRVKVF